MFNAFSLNYLASCFIILLLYKIALFLQKPNICIKYLTLKAPKMKDQGPWLNGDALESMKPWIPAQHSKQKQSSQVHHEKTDWIRLRSSPVGNALA